MAQMTSIWDQDRLSVKVGLTENGSLTFSGYDLKDNNDYEYAITVAAADIPTVLAALPGRPEDDVIRRLKANAKMIITMGESTWLKSLGIETTFWSHGEWSLFE